MAELRPSHHVSPSTSGHQPPKIAPMPVQHVGNHGEELSPIDLVEEVRTDQKIRAFGVTGSKQHHEWKRKPFTTGQGAVRIRSFHGKLSDQGLAYLDEAVNEWLDQHPEVEVKFVTSNVGVFEGKMREPALVLNLWY
jgi:hypothetical protein